MATNQKNFNVNIDEKLSDEFSAQVEKRAYTKYRSIEGALRVFMALPPEIQVRLMDNNISDVYTMLVGAIRDIELTKYLREMPAAQRDRFLQASLEVYKKIFRKK